MCKENKICLVIFLSALLLCCIWGALQAEEQWYLIPEPELRCIEEYRQTSEREKRNWLSQVQALKAASNSLNSQLARQRDLNRELTQSFNEYEQEQLTRLSLKNGEIAALREESAAKDLKIQKSRTLNIILGGVLVLVVVVIAAYLYVKIRTGGGLKLLKLFG